MHKQNDTDTFGIILLIVLFISLSYAAFLAYKSIDYKILNRLEETPLNLPPSPTPIPQTLQPR